MIPINEIPPLAIEPARPAGVIDYPPVRFTAFFTSLPIREEMHLSSLVVVWFQDRQHPVIGEEALAAMERLDWNRLALDYET
jgi:hypothetical protein